MIVMPVIIPPTGTVRPDHRPVSWSCGHALTSHQRRTRCPTRPRCNPSQPLLTVKKVPTTPPTRLRWTSSDKPASAARSSRSTPASVAASSRSSRTSATASARPAATAGSEKSKDSRSASTPPPPSSTASAGLGPTVGHSWSTSACPSSPTTHRHLRRDYQNTSLKADCFRTHAAVGPAPGGAALSSLHAVEVGCCAATSRRHCMACSSTPPSLPGSTRYKQA